MMKKILMILPVLFLLSTTIIRSGSDTLALIESKKNPGLFGVINQEGTVLIPPRYKSVRILPSGFALYRDDNDRVRYINTTGIEVEKFELKGTPGFLYLTLSLLNDVSEGEKQVVGIFRTPLFAVSEEITRIGQYSNGMIDVFNERTQKYGYVDLSGEIVVECKYDYVYYYRDGIAMVLKDKKRFYIDKKGQNVFNQDWPYASQFNEGMASVFNGKKWGAIDTSGRLVIDYQYDYSFSFSEGLACVILEGKGFERYYYIDKTGKVVIDCDKNGWNQAQGFISGLAGVRRKSDNRWIYINKEGKLAFPADFAIVKPFKRTANLEEYYASFGTSEDYQALASRPALALVTHPSIKANSNEYMYETFVLRELRPVYINTRGEIVSEYFRDE
jgi:hypothetical protein